MIGKNLALGILAALTLITLARIISTYNEFSDTYDEGAHIASGLEFYQNHRNTLDPPNPPTVRLLLASLPYLYGYRLSGEGTIVDRWRDAIEKDGPGGSLITLARLGNLPFVILLIVFTYLFAAALYGRLAGLAAVVVVTNSPSLLGHAGMAAIDFGVTSALLAASYLVFRWTREPNRRRGLAAAAGCALALTCKFSALVWVPMIVAAYYAVIHRKPILDPAQWTWRSMRPAVLGGAKFAAVTLVLAWAVFGFDFEPLRDGAQAPSKRMKQLFPEGEPLSGAALWLSANVPLPMAGMARGFISAAAHAHLGHGPYYHYRYNQYLLGETKSDGGWWYYFPLAIGVKSTIPFLLLLAIALGTIVFGRRRYLDDGTLCILAGAGGILAVGMASTINIGIRHILPVYPFLAILVSSLFAENRLGMRYGQAARVGALILLAAHVVQSARAHPDYLAYFNEFAAGREHEFLADSNLDWGQDMKRLASYAREHNTFPLHVADISMRWRIHFWLPCSIQFEPPERPTGWLAVSLNQIAGVRRFDQGDFRWLLNYTPRAKVGKSFWLYYIDPPPDLP